MEFYNKHYIRIREDGCIVDGFSDAFREPTEDAICINEQGGYQFRLVFCSGELYPDGKQFTMLSEENPTLFESSYTVPLYQWDGEVVIQRTAEAVEAELAVAMLPTESQIRAERDKLLTETDWTQVLDAPISAESREAFRLYRQALRDITEQAGFPVAVVWPVAPIAVKADPDPVDTAVDVLLGEEEQ